MLGIASWILALLGKLVVHALLDATGGEHLPPTYNNTPAEMECGRKHRVYHKALGITLVAATSDSVVTCGTTCRRTLQGPVGDDTIPI